MKRTSCTIQKWARELNKYFTDLVDVNFTAKTEDTLDDVSNGKQDAKDPK